ncbi:hypothetical protein JNB_06379 [Janibacter sp. HTCC2649]|uniref:hypothetical protein n=1 Tax=Janibacter sp. HTCC2649 TaxID=313589 RepID=UPI000067094F|nr:hypothetical protein [Janibacter sp. HTCC2649]EAP99773.1 hypothetical protein JNB_06379 [Janibacter sp. HTCC2649]
MTTKGNDVERRGSDVMRALRAADPAGLADLTRTDERAFRALREGITMTTRDAQGKTARRGRRALAAGGLAVALVGGGAAYAGYDKWYAGGGDDGGVNCLTTWVDPQSPDVAKVTSGGPVLSADPIADCQKYQALVGQPSITDPVVFTYGGKTYVTPRDKVPTDAGAAPEVEADADQRMILRASLGDYVDGGNSKCFGEKEAAAFVTTELARLGLTGVKVNQQAFEPGAKCASMDYDPPTGEVLIMGSPDGISSPSNGPMPTPSSTSVPSDAGDGGMHDVADALRVGISEKCLSLPEAEAITKQALGALHHWPTSAVVDAKAKCTTVDLQVGGSMQVFLRGPSTTG